MKQSASNRKVNEQAREVIASILLFDVSDPRLHLVTITGCEVSYDRSVCNVYYTTDPERYAGAQAAFEAAAGHIRSLMAKKLSWRVAPELRFYVDTSVDQAEAISQALGKKLIIWNIKSTTKAQDGLYVYDTVQRLYDSQFGGEGVDDIKKYIKLGKLGEAFSADEQVILLIDEIDKADLEFPNDLLWELDKMEFYIPETKETIAAKQRPIVIITSNAEKELPDAFLRRCVFHYIEFPEQEQMEAILRVHFGDLEEKLVKQSLAAFYWLRELRGIEKKPSTSELVDWIRALVAGGVDPARIEKEIPFAGVLLKKDKDLQTLRKVK